MRFSEEVVLLQEEMRRVLRFMDWHAGWWMDQRHRLTGLPDAEAEGMAAYANRQAVIRKDLANKFRQQWADVPKLLALRERHPEVQGQCELGWILMGT
jgi:hypothetical protein